MWVAVRATLFILVLTCITGSNQVWSMQTSLGEFDFFAAREDGSTRPSATDDSDADDEVTDGKVREDEPSDLNSLSPELLVGELGELVRSVESLNAELTQLEQIPEDSDVITDEITTLIRMARLQLWDARSAINAAAGFEADFRETPKRIGELKRLLKEGRFEPDLRFNASTPPSRLPSTAQLEVLLASRRAELSNLRRPAQSLEAAQTQARIESLQASIGDSQQRLEEVKDQLQTPGNASDETYQKARRVRLEAERLQQLSTIESARMEIRLIEARTEVPAIQQQVDARRMTTLEQEVDIIESAIDRIRKNEIRRLKAKSVDARDQVDPSLLLIAESNQQLVLELSELTEAVRDLQEKSERIRRDTISIEREQKTTRTRIKVIGLSDSFGQMLQRNRASLIDTQQRYLPANERNRQIADAQIEIFRREDELNLIGDPLAAAAQTADHLRRTGKIDRDDVSTVTEDAGDIYRLRKEILQKLQTLQKQKLQVLIEVKNDHAQLLKAAEQYANLIDENILWVRSAPVISTDDLQDLSHVAVRLTDASQWKTVGQSLTDTFRSRFIASVVILLTSIVILILKPGITKSLHANGQKAARRGCRVFDVTMAAFLQTMVLSLAFTSPLLVLGWMLTNDPLASQFSVSLGRASLRLFLVAVPLEFLRQCCREQGLADMHFSWPEKTRKVLRKNLAWLMLLTLPMIGLLIWLPMVGSNAFTADSTVDAPTAFRILQEEPRPAYDSDASYNPGQSPGLDQVRFSSGQSWNRLGRVVLLGTLLMFLVFIVRTLPPIMGVGDRDGQLMSSTALSRLHYLVLAATIVAVLILMVMALVGYYFSAIKIGTSLLQTVALVIGVVVLHSAAMRLLLVRRRNLRYEQLVHQRKQARLVAEKKGAAEVVAGGGDVIEVDLQNEPGLDITDVSRQARELTGIIVLVVASIILLSIWQYLLPATKIMDDWKLWQITIAEKVQWVTLRDLVFSATMFAVTYFGVRNMPGMLELLLLQRLPLDAGARYAVTSIFRYILLVVGAIFALGYLKIPWSNYSWLVAAISVGLGFGLQEIVANFVSGLILLLERPVRVGDVVTIDGTTGIVSRIQMRATTVTNWDNQELVVPNKDLISGKLLNWTLSSVVNRIALKFGVAYGTDPERVQKIILAAIESNRALLKEPTPMVTFEEFADSSLNFTLRCCVSTIERRWLIIHDLNVAINRALEAESISIPYPQRDLHIIDHRAAAAKAPTDGLS